MNEQWRMIDGYPDYEVSDQGRVRRTTSRTCAKAGSILKAPLRNGYPCVDLCRQGDWKRTHNVHRLVAAAFIGPCSPGQEVNHKNGVKTDNPAVNLEYVTSSENSLHAYSSGMQDASGERNGQAKLTCVQVEQIREIAARPGRPSYAAIGRSFGVSDGTIRYIVSGRGWRVPPSKAEKSEVAQVH